MINPEQIIYDYLNPHLTVYVDVPKEHASEYVTIERIGGRRGRSYIFDDADMVLRVYAETRYKASQLAYVVNDLMQVAPEQITSLTQVENVGFSYLPDLENKQPIYQLVYELTFMCH